MSRAKRCATFAVLVSFALVACSSSVGPTGPPPAHPGQQIRRLLQQDVPLVVRPRDLRADSPVRRALARAGMIVAAHLSEAALRESKPCGYFDLRERGTRCFSLARRELVRVVGLTVRNATLDAGGQFIFSFAFRAIPRSSLAKKLAASQAFVCAGDRNRSQPWKGRSTIAYGSYYAPFPRDPLPSTVDADCPMIPRLARLR